MKPGNDMEKKIGQVLNSLDGVQRAEPQPWLYAGIKRRLSMEEDRTVWGSVSSFLARPAVVIVGLCLILVVNAFILFNQETGTSASSALSEQAQTQESESLIASSSRFDYENLVQP